MIFPILSPLEQFSKNLELLKRIVGEWQKKNRNVESSELESIENKISRLFFRSDGL